MEKSRINYDEPIEVTEAQYHRVASQLKGFVAFREEGGKFFVKLWATKFRVALQRLLNDQ